MAGTLVANTINTDTGLFSTQNAYNYIPKAWVNFNGGNGNTAGVINQSYNVSSVTVNGTGDYTINFATAMPNANYTVFGSVLENINDATLPTNRIINCKRTPPLTTSVRVAVTYPVDSTVQASYYNFVSILSV